MRGGVTRTPIRFLLVLSAMAVALLIPTSAFAINWASVTGPTSSIQEVAKVRSADGTLHVVWTRDRPGASTQDVFHVAISAGGAVGTPTEIAAGFSIAGNPAIVNLPGGGLEVFFGGIQCTSPGCPEGLFTATSADRGSTWTTPAALFDRDSVYASDVSATTLPDGTPFETWSATAGVFVHRGLSPLTPDYEYHDAMGAGCCGYYSNLATNGIGRVQLAWDSNATSRLGVWSQAVDPATGAPSGSPRLMRGSVTSYNGAPNHSQMLQRTPLVGLPDDQTGLGGEFVIAYPAGYPETKKVLLWYPRNNGETNPMVDEPGSHDQVSVATDARTSATSTWVFWTHSVSGGPHVFACPDYWCATFGLPPIDMGAPAGAQSIYKLDGDVTPAGYPEVLALTGRADGTHGTYYARGPKVAFLGSLGIAVSNLKLTGGFVSVPLRCSSRVACNGRLSITTKPNIGTKANVGNSKTVLCNTTSFKVKAGKKKSIKAKIYAACRSLLHHARGHHIKAQFTSRPRTRQRGLTKNITLRL
jgi:hypothetical protein